MQIPILCMTVHDTRTAWNYELTLQILQRKMHLQDNGLLNMFEVNLLKKKIQRPSLKRLII